MRLHYLPCLTGLALASCAVPSPEPAPQPQPPRSTEPAPLPPTPQIVQPQGHWTDWPMEAGQWVYRIDDRGSIALFGQPGRDALITLRCDKGLRMTFLSVAGVTNFSRMTVRTSSTSKTVETKNTGGKPPYVAVAIAPTDPILDALAYSRGRVAFEPYGDKFIAIPLWSEIGRVVEDCR
jgi:hypothetical protein